VVRDAIFEWFELETENLWEQAAELLTTPRRNESREFRRILERQIARQAADRPDIQPAFVFDEESVFSGKRKYSEPKLAAMIEYLTSRGLEIYKTQLNKLLFYSDLAFFDLAGVGISGAVYRNRPFGPVADPVEDLLSDLSTEGRIVIDARPDRLGQKITSPSGEYHPLAEDECKVMDWVLETYGAMRSGEITDLSHNELAYKNTRPNEPIAYEYAKFFKRRPPQDLIS